MNTVEIIKQEVRDNLAHSTIEELEDNSGQFIDNCLPIYNSDIIQEWQNMPSEYDNRGSSELGIPNEISIISLMLLDLYLYYSDIFNEAITELKEELEEETLIAN
jgi:hypothetical protein